MRPAQTLAEELCVLFDLNPRTITRLVITIDAGAPFATLDVEQIVTEDVDADADALVDTFARYELHAKEIA